jgi:hypothetical protein
VYTSLCFGTSHAARKTQSFVDFDKKSYSALVEIFRRFDAHFTPFHTQKVEEAALCFGTRPAGRKTQSFVDFDKNYYFVPD